VRIVGEWAQKGKWLSSFPEGGGADPEAFVRLLKGGECAALLRKGQKRCGTMGDDPRAEIGGCKIWVKTFL